MAMLSWEYNYVVTNKAGKSLNLEMIDSVSCLVTLHDDNIIE